MRILSLRFKNLNSLVGEWSLDFTHSAFATEGIFAITGPTGAGKSTILDAICLGLFGRTPRLEKINESSNEIMSQHTGECFAEVTFAVPFIEDDDTLNLSEKEQCALKNTNNKPSHRVLRSYWYQRKANKKREGKLQAHSFELSDATTGKIITSAKSEVPKEIERLTGMDFKRFTRSMMLAQGGFSAFLQATADERSPLLEQITGTEIYTEISKIVHEKTRDASKSFDEKKIELESVSLLSEDDIQVLCKEKQDIATLAQEASSALTQSREKLAWLRTITTLKTDIVAYKEKQNSLNEAKALFRPHGLRLSSSKRAKKYIVAHIELKQLRDQLATFEKKLTETEKSLPQFKGLVSDAELNKNRLLLEYQVFEKKYADALLLLKEVRLLDEKIQGQKNTLTLLTNEEKQLEKYYLETKTTKQKAEKQQVILHETLRICKKTMEATPQNAVLIEAFTGIKERLLLILRLAKETEDKDNAIKKIKETIVSIHSQTEVCKSEKETLVKSKHEVESTQKENTKQAYDILQGNPLESLIEKKFSLEASIKELEEIKAKVIDIHTQSAIIQEQEKLEQQFSLDHKQFFKQRDSIKEKTSWLKKEEELFQRQVVLLQRIASYEEERKKLVEGAPCPLCGAIEHPFASDTPAELSSVEKELQNMQSQLGEAQKTLTELENSVTTSLLYQKDATKRKIEAEGAKHQHCSLLDTLLSNANYSFTSSNLLAEGGSTLISKELIVKKELLAHTIASLEKASFLQKKITESLEKLTTLNKLIAEVDTKIFESLSLQKKEEAILDSLRKEKTRMGEALHEDIKSLEEDVLIPYGISVASISTATGVNAILGALEQKKKLWIELKNQEEKATKDLLSVNNTIISLSQQCIEQKKLLDAKKEQITTVEKLLSDVKKKRYDLLQNNDADAYEYSCKQQVENALSLSKQAEDTYSTFLQQFKEKQNESIAYSTKVIEYTAEKERIEPLFLKKILEAGFSDEVFFEESLLSPEEEDLLEEQEQHLIKQSTEIESLLKEKMERLDVELQKKSTEQTIEQIEIDAQQTNERLIALQKALGGIEHKLSENQKREKEKTQQVAIFNKYKKEANRWKLLHDLIGSADGKKFRNFAQGLTFDIMINHANMQLQKMTDRYFLLRDKESPLELHVIDNYQAGEHRSTRNLSGGESFIVSLALALGLSNMASGKMRVDSLFLDEGFGSLDEEALEIALDTLAGLRQEGKLIGLISHVNALKERIGLQLTVKPTYGGKSILYGPGCSHI